MKLVEADEKLVAYCGLYCGACRAYWQGRCPGCNENVKASWCGVRKCCIENEFSSCAYCRTFDDPKDCKKYNNFFAKLFGFVFRSDRRACIMQIKEKGRKGHAEIMAKAKRQSIKR